jgi:hypothetical protein
MNCALKNRLLPSVFAVAALLAASMSSVAQEPSIKDHPGFFDFDVIPRSIQLEPNVEINIKGALLRLAAEATVREDPELAEMLRNLKLIRVFTYENDGWTDQQKLDFSGLARRIGTQLEEKGWDIVARVRDRDEHVFVYLREVREAVEGMIVMVVEADEAVFVNITGTIDPAQVGRIGSRFDIDVLQDVEIDGR